MELRREGLEHGGFFGGVFGLGESGEAEEVVQLFGGDGGCRRYFGGGGRRVGKEGFDGPAGLAQVFSDLGAAYEGVRDGAAVGLLLPHGPRDLYPGYRYPGCSGHRRKHASVLFGCYGVVIVVLVLVVVEVVVFTFDAVLCMLRSLCQHPLARYRTAVFQALQLLLFYIASPPSQYY